MSKYFQVVDLIIKIAGFVLAILAYKKITARLQLSAVIFWLSK